MRYLLLTLVFSLLLGCDPAPAPAPGTAATYEEKIVELNPATAAAEARELRAAASVEVDPVLRLSLYAADSLVTDPIAISMAPDGRLFYTRAERMGHSEFDVRGHMDWTEDIMALQTVEERRAFLRKTFTEGSEQSELHLKDLNKDGVKDWQDLTVQKESVWFVTDRDGDGVADRSQRFLQDFNTEVTDVANGIEFFDDEVYVTVAPDLWKAGDDNGDGTADRLESIATGFGVHIGFGGHGLSGVTVGPMGRLWWGIGDIGSNIVAPDGKQWKNPNRGVIVRCDPDGSNFEVFAHGLRNTHEFDFDAYGNLITIDNDGDHAGERERLLYVIDGSDTGWRINWQYGKYTDDKNNNYKVWMDEGMHLPRHEEQAAYFLPPIQNYVNGPTGLVYNPGTGLGEEFMDHFFVAEFRGSPGNSPVHAFTMEPQGAGFKLGKTRKVVEGLLPTGLDFGPDGALYFGDWINGWGAKGKGKIWKLEQQGAGQTDRMRGKQLASALTEDWRKKPQEELTQELTHMDQRIRFKAQFVLAKRGVKSFDVFRDVVLSSSDEFARVHAIWGMAQVVRQHGADGAGLLPLLTSLNPEVLAQTAKAVGDLRIAGGEDQLIELLQHRSPRVRFFAAEALGRLEVAKAVEPIVDMLRENDDEDVYLRQAGMIALGRIGLAEPLVQLAHDPSRAVRTAAVVALRRMADPGVASFLFDRDPYLVAEAARAIHDDFSIPDAMEKLAGMLEREELANEVVLRRAISASLRLGRDDDAKTLVAFAQRQDAPAAMRAEALLALSSWAKPSVFDRVTGRHRGKVARDGAYATDQFNAVAESLLKTGEDPLRLAVLRAGGSLGLPNGLAEGLLQTDRSPTIRAAALATLSKLQVDGLDQYLLLALDDGATEVRSEALRLLPKSAITPEQAVALYRKVMDEGSVSEAQSALAGLSGIGGPAAASYLGELFTRLQKENLPDALWLDVIAAAEALGDPALSQRLEEYEAELMREDSLGYHVFALAGGNPAAGRPVFRWNSTAQCTRCHAVFEYGGNVGPNLSGLASRMSPREILTSVIHPSAAMAPGYETILITLNDESMLSGILLNRTDEDVTLRIGKTETRTVALADVAEMETLPSSMPSIDGKLSRQEIRDLVAWLATLKGEHTK